MFKFRSLHLSRLIAFASAFVIGAAATAMAQSPAPKPTPAKSTSTVEKKHPSHGGAVEQSEMNERLKQLADRLKLTDDQVAKVSVIMQAKRVQLNEVRMKFKGQPTTPENKAAMEKAHQQLHADFDAKLAQVLTADQLTEYKKMHMEHMKKEGAKEEKEENEAKK